tara:strand:- start:12 stop:863 length:852 start_codon:yes stop_codon:yes gene_type:complete
MRYVLAIGLETEIYKNPSLDVFLNDRFLGTTELDESIPAEIQQHKKGDLLDAWDFRPYSNPERTYKITLPKKWIIYELDDSDFNKDNRLDIVPKNLQTNTMNGFVTKMDKCKIFNVMLLPKDWFSSDGVQKIFSHCDGRNVVIDFDWQHGWPLVPLPTDWDGKYIKVGTEAPPCPVYNEPNSYSISYDEILEIYIIDKSSNDAEAESTLPMYTLPMHTTIKKTYEHFRKHSELDSFNASDERTQPSHPQKLFEKNDETTLLRVKTDVKLQLDQIATKYQHNEN